MNYQSLSKLILSVLFFCCTMVTYAAESKTISSPNGRLKLALSCGKTLSFQVFHGAEPVTQPSEIGLQLKDGTMVGSGLKSLPSKITSNKQHVEGIFYRQKSYTTSYNGITIKLGYGFNVEFRVYDEGVAYRFSTSKKGETIVKNEIAKYAFAPQDTAWLAYSTNDEKPFAMAFQNFYDRTSLSEAKDKLAFLPVTVQSGGVKVTLMESDLRSYPGMYVKTTDGNTLSGTFAPYATKTALYEHRHQSYVTETADFIAKSNGARTYPWRIFAITEHDTDMPVNNLVYTLAEPNKLNDVSWIKPGKVAWDWWNDWNLKGVDFKAGLNDETYKYYIDFASRNNIKYVVLDEGWYNSDKGDIMNSVKDIDLSGLIAYGKQKNVDIVLWAVFNVLDENLDAIMSKYSAMGVKGFKVDFLDRDDQTAVEMAYRLAESAARHHMILDYHGFYKPTGMSRTYPNILNYEGVFGMEEARWAKKETDMPLYDVTFPYIRMMAGQVDFTPGAMRNGTRYDWSMVYTKPVSMGTRCHQLACYVVHDSPFTMLCDSPTNYEREQECTDMITSIPEVFDRTIIPIGEMGKYIVTARQKGDDWYVGGQTNWDGRDVKLNLNFLEQGKSYRAIIFRDGINAYHDAEDYKREEKKVNANTTLTIPMVSGGGFVMRLIQVK